MKQYFDILKHLHEYMIQEKSDLLLNAPPVLSKRENSFSKQHNQRYIFISYSHRDFEYVYSDLNRLWAINANYWYDKEFLSSPTSENWMRTTEKMIQDSNCVGVLFYVSRNSFMSDAVYHEIKACINRRKKDKYFSYKIVFIDGDNIFDIQNACKITSGFTSERLITLHSLWGAEIINIKYDHTGSHIYDVAGWFVKMNCINTFNFDQPDRVIARDDYLIMGDCLVSYHGTSDEFNLLKGDHISKIAAGAIATPFVKHIRFPEGVIEIDDFAIMGCNHLESVYIPASVQRMSFFALSNFNFDRIDISKDNTHFKTDEHGFVFIIDDKGNEITLFASPNHNKVTFLKMKDTVMVINDFAMSCCLYLEEVIFSMGLKRIGYWALKENVALKKITLYPSIEYISPTAFHLTTIKTVCFKGTKEEWDEHPNINEAGSLKSMFKDAEIVFD